MLARLDRCFGADRCGFPLELRRYLGQDRGHHPVGKRPGRLRVLNPLFKPPPYFKILTPLSNTRQNPKSYTPPPIPNQKIPQTSLPSSCTSPIPPLVLPPLYTVRYTYLPQHRVLARDSGCLTSQMFHVKHVGVQSRLVDSLSGSTAGRSFLLVP